MSKLDELIDLIKKEPNYAYYQELEVRINDNETIRNLVNEIKQLQTQIVLAREVKKDNKVMLLEENYEELLKKLEDVPHVVEYLELQKHYNDLIQNIKTIIESDVEKMLK